MAARFGLLYGLQAVGRGDEARAIAEEVLTEAREFGSPFWVAGTLNAYGVAFAATDPARSLGAYREGLAYAQQQRLPSWQALIARDAANVEAAHGELPQALTLFDTAIASLHQTGDYANLRSALANLAVVFDLLDQPDMAATIYGTSTRHPGLHGVRDLRRFLDHLRTVLSETTFNDRVAAGKAMESTDAVRYARDQIHLARQELRAERPEPDGAR
jgi:tetratricopeptide (TPR) repeat protein